jgi:hypothetical protein
MQSTHLNNWTKEQYKKDIKRDNEISKRNKQFVESLEKESKTQIVFEIIKDSLTEEDIIFYNFENDLNITKCNMTGFYYAPIENSKEIKDLFSNEIKYSLI